MMATDELKTDYAAARAAGDKFYLGPVCSRPGHGAVRYVNSRACRDCSREKAARRRQEDRTSRTDDGGFTRRVFVLGDPARVTSVAGNGQ